MIRCRSLCFAITLLCLAPASVSAEGWGNLRGRFVYDGERPEPKRWGTSKEPLCHDVFNESLLVSEGGGLANVVVFVESAAVKVHPDYEGDVDGIVRVKIEGCRYQPHTTAMRLSQTLEIHGCDPFLHNPIANPLGDDTRGRILVPDTIELRRIKKAQVFPVDCSIHPWERGWVVATEHPYVAITDRDGNFQLQKLPAQELELRVWHERAWYLRARKEWGNKGTFKFNIKPGDNKLGTVKIDPKLLEKQ